MSNFDKVRNDLKNDPHKLYEEAQDKAANLYNDIKNKSESVSQQVKDTMSGMYEEGKKGG